MKKTALTFGLFSLAMVATSFAPQSLIINEDASVQNNKTTIAQESIIPPDGSIVGGNKKRDFHGVTAKLDINGSIVRGNKKLDL